MIILTDIEERSFFKCGNEKCSLRFVSNINNINKEAFAFSSFSIIKYDGIINPNCL